VLRCQQPSASSSSTSSSAMASSVHCLQRSSANNADSVTALTTDDCTDTLAANNIHGSDTLATNESCRKKLRFAVDSCETDLHGGP